MVVDAKYFFNFDFIMDLSFFNFHNAVTACYYADSDLNVLRVNDNFKSFFPVLGNVTGASFPDVLKQLGVDHEIIDTFSETIEKNGSVMIPHIFLQIDGEERVYSLLSAKTHDENFSYLNGIQGQFVDRTSEFELRKKHDLLMEEKLSDREIIEAKTRQLEELANRLAKYLSPQIYNSIFAGNTGDTREFARKNLTIFFSDIEGFTDISDGMEPERLAFMINTYLSEMSNIAIEYGGTIDKFIGDAIMVFFGDPETDGEANDALKCAKMALRMQERVAELRSTWIAKGISKPVKVRMGISAGYCTVGNFGSEMRLDYTVLGGPVNLAARLQTAAEADTILISDETHLLLQNKVSCTKKDSITPKGFVRPIQTYVLNGLVDGEILNPKHHALSRVGTHVEVNVPDSRNIREAIEELKIINDELQTKLEGM